MIGQVENAMLARIAAASEAGVIPYAYVTLETWPKAFDEYLSSRQVRYPAAWAAYAGSHKIERVARGRSRAHCAFGIVVAAQNLRNEAARRLGGSASEVGSYQMAEDVVRLLQDQTLGLDIDALTAASILPVETSDIPSVKQISLYAVTFETAIYYDTAAFPGDLSPFATFHADWDPAPYGRVSEPLPDDAAASAVDNVTLETV
jgi:phage gp37-like protein